MATPFTKPSEAPAGGDGWKFSVEDNIGALFVIEPLEEVEIEDKFNGGTRKVINSNVTEVDLDDPASSVTHDDVWIFPAWVQGAIRSNIADGGMVLGRLVQDAEKGVGKNKAWVLEDPDDEDVEAATAWHVARSASKFKKKAKN